jgi:FkbH-like protein
MNELASRIAASSRGFGGYFYKILVLDCDNTLWGGVVGEELLNGIKLDPYEYPGNIYWSVQQEFAALESQGIILAIVSKNNPADVEEVFQKHPNMVLKDAHIAAKKINWTDKPSNLRALANDLNVGLESIIFLDDSSFECEAVRKQLPMVKTLQVPTNLSDYPNIVAEIKSLLLAGGLSTESKNKTEQYRQRAEAEELKVNFETQEEYLASLKIKVELMRNARASIGRISELSQKSNQFNLTTRRYTIAEIEQLIESGSYSVYSLVVGDKFGNAGLTGVAVMRYENDLAIIENFFMSCRVIGRGIETSIWGHIVTDVIKRGCSKLSAVFIPSNKNEQVSGFYNSLGLQLTMECDGALHYTITSADFVVAKKSWIEIAYVE